ncbi:MAG: hypothetical protein GJ676_01245 [Rhodobacteraceae bacterium]|nr:hypothetical protein [Paracoccaceae bacterium]
MGIGKTGSEGVPKGMKTAFATSVQRIENVLFKALRLCAVTDVKGRFDLPVPIPVTTMFFRAGHFPDFIRGKGGTSVPLLSCQTSDVGSKVSPKNSDGLHLQRFD